METQAALNNLDKALAEEGVPEEERQIRVQILKECIEFGETTSAKMNAAKATKKPVARMPVAKAIELSIMALVIGWFAGIFTLHYYQIQQ